MRRRGALGLLLACVTLAACQHAARPAATTAVAGPSMRFRLANARGDLDRWDAVAAAATGRRFRPTSPTIRVVGTPEPEYASAVNAMAFGGRLTLAPASGGPVDRSLTAVRWADGTTVGVDVEPAGSAADDIHNLWVTPGDDCGDCNRVFTTPPRLVTDTVDTAFGPATAPFWSWGVKGSRVRIERLAVRMPVGIVPPPRTPVDVTTYEGVRVGADGRTLTVNLIGGPPDAAQPCGRDYTAEVVESAYAVLPIVIDRYHVSTVPCDAGGHLRSATVTLAAPLADRTVLSEVTGLPVPTNYS